MSELKPVLCSQHLQQAEYELRGRLATEANRLIQAGHDIRTLHLGNPGLFGLHAPAPIVQAVADNLVKSQAYCHSYGLPEAREAILSQWNEKVGVATDRDSIFIGNGVSELIHVALGALINPGDEVLVPQPNYPLWTAVLNLQGGKAASYQCDEANEWQPDIAHMASMITEKTKAIVVINPNNPTGAVYSKEVLEQIVALAKQHQLILFADEIYSDIVYPPDTFNHLASISGDDVFTISFTGLSKNYTLAGYRCAWMVLSGEREHARDYIAGIEKLMTMRLCANVPSQYAIKEALSKPEYTLLNHYPDLLARRDQLMQALNAIDGLSCVTPKGAFYAFPRWDSEVAIWDHDEQWALQLLQQYHVLISPGSTFEQPDPYHFRLVFLPAWEELADTCVKLQQLKEQGFGLR